MIYLGIDPGIGGGMAWVNPGGTSQATKMLPTDKDNFEWLQRVERSSPVVACIEKVQGYIGIPHPGSAMFKFGYSYGSLCMALTALKMSYEEVSPRTWQKAIGISSRGKTETTSAFKNRLKAKAQRLFPNCQVTLHTADALLIAYYCYRHLRIIAERHFVTP